MINLFLRLNSISPLDRRDVIFIFFFMLVSSGLQLLVPWPMKLLTDSVFMGQPLPKAVDWLYLLPGSESLIFLVAWLAFGTVLVFVTRMMNEVILAFVRTDVSSRMTFRLRTEVYYFLQRLSLNFHSRQSTGDLIKRIMSDCGCYQILILNVFLTILNSLIFFILMFVVMWQINQMLTFIALIVVPFQGGAIMRISPRMAKCFIKQQEHEGELMAVTERALTSLPVVQSFGREEYEQNRFKKQSQNTLKKHLETSKVTQFFILTVESTTAAGRAAMFVAGGFQVSNGLMTVGELLVFLVYLEAMYAPIDTMVSTTSGYSSVLASAKRIFEIMDMEEDVNDMPKAKPLTNQQNQYGWHVKIEKVTYGYEFGHPVLKEVSIDARPGEKVAIIGETGSGKSTLVSLIPRLFDPWSGCVTLDGKDIREFKVRSLRSNVAMVLQDPFILPLSVAENIAYGRPNANQKEIIEAAVAANAHNFIEQLSDGYNTPLGERGITLSGGQKQRLAIARALLINAPILILDEPTSSLDAHTELLLMQALENLMQGKTTFIIAHRLSTIRTVDRIFVLKDGKNVESGTHDELLKIDGTYRRLYQSHIGSPEKQ